MLLSVSRHPNFHSSSLPLNQHSTQQQQQQKQPPPPPDPQTNLLYRSPSPEVCPSSQQPKLKQPLPLILVTGATGYIGSHVVLEILRQGKWGVVGIDNLSNSTITSLRRVRQLAGPNAPPLFFHQLDLRHPQALSELFDNYHHHHYYNNHNSQSSSSSSFSGKHHKTCAIVHVIHLAALKSVSGSRKNPEAYFETNVLGTQNLLDAMERANVRSLVFSSSAVVYGSRNLPLVPSSSSSSSSPDQTPLSEDCCIVKGTLGAGQEAYDRLTSPYGSTKLRCEELVHQATLLGNLQKAVILRYSNPSGNHQSGLLGDSPHLAENLMPIVTQVLQGKRDYVCIYGKDYNTRDGTGVRDFIHVQDLAKGHLAALESFSTMDNETQKKKKKKQKKEKSEKNGLGNVDDDDDGVEYNCRTYNLSTGEGATVQEVINALSLVSGKFIKTLNGPRREGDLDKVICDPLKAFKELNGWKAEKTILDMARDMWTFCLKNPNGLI